MGTTKNSIAGMKVGRPSGETNITPDLIDKIKDKPKPLRVTFEMSEEQHLKLKLFAVKNKKTMIAVLRDFIDSL
jgi:hypothetical protein